MTSENVPYRGKSLQIGITCHRGEMRAETCAGVCDALVNGAQHDLRITVKMRNNITSIELARNLLVADFLQSGHDYLLMVDNDIGFSWPDLRRLLVANCDVISGVYPYKNFSLQETYKAADRHVSINQLLRQAEPVPCDYIPSGFLLIKRSTIERIVTLGAQKIQHQHEILHRIFKTYFDEERGILLGEDYAFSEAVRGIGVTPFSHFGVILKHFGAHAYGFDPRNMAMSQAGSQPPLTHGRPGDG